MLLSTENAIARLRETGDGDTLGGRIWRARDATGLSTKELASKLGVRSDTISSWERDRAEPEHEGERARPVQAAGLVLLVLVAVARHGGKLPNA